MPGFPKKDGTKKRTGKGVSFKDNYVDGVTEPIQSEQHWTLYYFEEHASHCLQCQNPYRVYKARQGLCKEGLDKAYDVAELLFKLKKDGRVYRHDQKTHQDIRIEVPKDYANCLQLLKAIQRSDKTFLQESHDRIYPVKSRIDSRDFEVREPEAPVPSRRGSRKGDRKSKRRYSTDPTKSGYGSLMVEDLIAEERRQEIESDLQYEEVLPQQYQYQYQQPYYYAPTYDYVNT
jgi:hypothetical protein